VTLQAADSQGHDVTSKTRDEAVYEESSTLCSRCSSIDVESLFVDIKKLYKATKLMSLGKLGVETELSSCSLCRLFYAVRIQDDDYPSVDDYALYVTPTPPSHPSWDGSVLAVIQETIDATKYLDRAVKYLTKRGMSQQFIACSNGSYTNRLAWSLRVRSIDSQSIDFDDSIRRWVQDCDQQHDRCKPDESSASSLKGMKLIDCELRQIVPASPAYKYSALSYVWGTSKSGDEDECVDNILPTTLPRTIEDAMSVTKALGLRHIWIDRYCIDQGNDAEKQIQISQMDLIYQKAFVTIIAAAGTDPHFGLPGVGATSRPPQPTAWIKGRCLVSTLPDPRLFIVDSKWMQRAWTYQENFFSIRRIVFTEQQVYYECRRGTTYETVHTLQNDFSLLDPGSSEHNPSGICDRLAEYCGREMSIESDAIRAFEGVFNNYRRLNHIHQYLGIPIMPLRKMGYLQDTHRSRGEAFAAGLSWCNNMQGTRRSLFPSWSWAGWTVSIKYTVDLCHYGLELGDERPLKVFIETRDGSLLDMDNVSDALLDQSVPGSSGKFIHIEAWTIPIDLRHFPDEAEELQYHNHTYDNGSGYLAIFQTDEGAVQARMYPLHQQDCAPDFKQGSLLGIVLGRCEDFSGLRSFDVIFIMVVQEKEQYHERVGHILLKQGHKRYHHHHNKNPRSMIPRWQTIFRLKERRTIRLG
jgi:hypothetical protein